MTENEFTRSFFRIELSKRRRLKNGDWVHQENYKITSDNSNGFIYICLTENEKGTITWSSGGEMDLSDHTVEAVTNFIESLKYAQGLVTEHDKQLS